MIADNGTSRRPEARTGSSRLGVAGREPRARIRARSRFQGIALAVLVASSMLCSASASWMYVRYLLSLEAARESRFVNAVIQESGLESAFYGRPDDAMDRILAAMRRPDVHRIELVSAAAIDSGEQQAGWAGQALRGEAVPGTAFWRWSIPLRPAVWREDPDAGPPLAFAVPVFDRAGSNVIGAALVRRASGGPSEAADRGVSFIWLTMLAGSLVLYGGLLASQRRGWPGIAWLRRDPSPVVEAPLVWRAAESALRREALRRGIRIESRLCGPLPALRANAIAVAAALDAFSRHALARAGRGAVLEISVRGDVGGVEFAYAVAAPAEEIGEAAGPMAEDTRALVDAARRLGGSMYLVIAPGIGRRAVLTLPA